MFQAKKKVCFERVDPIYFLNRIWFVFTNFLKIGSAGSQVVIQIYPHYLIKIIVDFKV